MPSPTIPSIIGGLLPSIYNPNLVSDESSRQVSLAEVEAIAITASLVGYDPETADGVFTFGGTGTLLYGVKIGLEKAVPEVRRNGLKMPAVLVCSDRAHYACLTVANWLGLGEDNVDQVSTTDDNQMHIDELASRLRDVVRRRPSHRVHRRHHGDDRCLRSRRSGRHRARARRIVREFALDYVPHVHADAVIGWAWSVFNDYDFEENPLASGIAPCARWPAPHGGSAISGWPTRWGRLPQDRIRPVHLQRRAAARWARLRTPGAPG